MYLADLKTDCEITCPNHRPINLNVKTLKSQKEVAKENSKSGLGVMKYLRKTTYLTAGVGLALTLGATDCFATAMDVVRPIESKATELNSIIVWGFWILVGVVLGYRILMISIGNENNRMKHMKALGWLSGGAIAIASIAKIITWLKAV